MVMKEENTVTVAFKENLHQSLSIVPAAHTERELISPAVPEKPSEDGYNWRKYGQKNVKGNVYIRSYYKCSYPTCVARKQVERSHDGRITDVTYLGEHTHAQPHTEREEAMQVQMQDCRPLVVDGDTPLDEHARVTDNVRPNDVCKSTEAVIIGDITPSQRRDEINENLILKRRKKGADGADMMLDKPSHESRVVIETVSEVDVVNDGYRWRKYGQKMVKGSPNPRSYYRCSTAGCLVKKQVERASHDPRIVITTYEGHHEHTLPPVRTLVPQSPSSSSLGGLDSYAVGKAKSEETDATDVASPENKPLASVVKINNEQLTSQHEGHHEHTLPSVRTLVPQTPSPASLGRLDANAVGKAKSEETDSIDAATSENKPLATVVKINNEQSTSQPELDNKPDHGDSIDPMLTEEEKGALSHVDIKSENVPTEQQEAEAPHDTETNSNGLQQIDAKPVKC